MKAALTTPNNTQKTIKLDRRFYPYRERLMNWCSENVGPGGWKDSDPELFPEMPEWRWTVTHMFGHTRFTFLEPDALQRFKAFLAELT